MSIADYRRLYDFEEAGRPDLAVPEAKFNRAKRIDTRLVTVLKNLPPSTFGETEVDFNDQIANLAFRNLTRGNMVRLASGQQMAAFMKSRGVAVTELTTAQVESASSNCPRPRFR